MWPPSRSPTAAARARFTRCPTRAFARLVRASVSCTTSTVNDVPATSTTVRHTPLTAIESPCSASVVTSGPEMVSRAALGTSSMPTTSPTSSTSPVNTASPFPGPRAGPSDFRRLAPQRPDGFAGVVGVVHRRARHEAVHPRLGRLLDRVGVDAAVDLHQQLQVAGVDQVARPAHLFQHVRDERLTTETGLDRHD